MIDIAKIAIPVLLGFAVWFAQTLAQRAWNEYESRRALYLEIVGFSESLFVKGPADDRRSYLRAIRKAWLVASDEVVISSNELLTGIKQVPAASADELDLLYKNFIDSMRRDLRKRRWLPPSKTKLTRDDYLIDSPA